MFSHVVIFWTDPTKPTAADDLLAGMKKYLEPIPGVLHFHAGKMARSHRSVVDQSYQVALNLVFKDKKTQDEDIQECKNFVAHLRKGDSKAHEPTKGSH